MLKKIIIWFVVYFLSNGISNILHSSEPDQIFFWIYTGVPILLLIVEMILSVRRFEYIKQNAKRNLQILTDEVGEINPALTDFVSNVDASAFTFALAFDFAVDMILLLGVTWLVTWMFELNFFIIYEIITLTLCFTKE